MLHILRKAALHVTVKYIECVSAGQMSDAAEVLMALYDALLPVAAKANQPGLLGAVFGIHVKVCLCLPLSSYARSCSLHAEVCSTKSGPVCGRVTCSLPS